VYFERMDNTQIASVEIAVGKAKSAATYRRPTRAFMDVINKGGPATATLPGVFASQRRSRRERRHRRPGRAMCQGRRR
jgi:uncharacterized protein GlcG (DUF336 family)